MPPAAANAEAAAAAAAAAKLCAGFWVKLAERSKEEVDEELKAENREKAIENGSVIGISNLRVRKRVKTRRMILASSDEAAPPADTTKAPPADAATRPVATKPMPLTDGFVDRRVTVAKLATALQHPNVLAHFGVSRGEVTRTTESFGGLSLELVMEWCDGGSLATKFKDPGPPESRRLRWCVETVWATAAMHSVGLSHRDHKPSNLLFITTPHQPAALPSCRKDLPNKGARKALADTAAKALAALVDPPQSGDAPPWWTARMVVSDFDVAVHVGHEKPAMCTTPRTGTYKYMAPEVFTQPDIVSSAIFAAADGDAHKGGYDAFPCDVFSLGVVMWEILTWTSAYKDHYMMAEDIGRAVATKPDFRPTSARPSHGLIYLAENISNFFRPLLGSWATPVAKDAPESLIALCARCWVPEPSERPTARVVLEELLRLITEDEDVQAWIAPPEVA